MLSREATMKRKRILRIVFFVLPVALGMLLTGCGLLGGLRPQPPSQVSATVDSFTDRIRVTWSAVPEAGAYEVWRGESENGEYELLARTGYNSYDDLSVTPGRTYWYRVKACNRFGCSDFSPAASGRARRPERPPSPPTGLQASQGTYADHIHLEWNAVSGAVHYEVYRAAVATASYVLLDTVEDTSYDDYRVSAGKTYWYKVRACSNDACSLLSEAVSGYAGVVGLQAPQGVTASDGDYPDKVIVSWQAVEGATNYLVYRASSQDGPYSPIADVEETSYEDTNVVPGTTYWYKVRACNADACSPLSSADSGRAGEEGPPPPPSS